MEELIVHGPKLKTLESSEDNYLGSIIFRRLKERGTKIAQVDSLTEIKSTYEDILHSTCLLAEILLNKFFKTGDVIGICSENRTEFIIPVIACIYIGVAVAPINSAYKSGELIHVLNITKPKTVFCSATTLVPLTEVAIDCCYIEELITFDRFERPRSLPCKVTWFQELLRQGESIYRPEFFRPIKFNSKDCTAFILCSSGTTGLPKGVMWSHANLEYNLSASAQEKVLEDDATLLVLPMFHSYGLLILLMYLMNGVNIIVLPRFDETLFLAAIEKYKVSMLSLVPPLMLLLAKSPAAKKYNLLSLRDIVCGGASCSPHIVEKVNQIIGRKCVRQIYGLTEFSSALMITSDCVHKTNSIGKLTHGTHAKIIDPDKGKTLGPEEVGEICLNGPQIMQGYYKNPKATMDTIDAECWLRTGDLGYYDRDGYFYIVDRLKELIKYKGFQVAPAELEALLLSYNGIKDAAVVGIPDKDCGEKPLACIVKEPGSKITQNEIERFIAAKVAPQKRLRGGVIFMDSIPKNSSGKIVRKQLKTLVSKL